MCHIHMGNKENRFAMANLGFNYFIVLNKGKAIYRSQKMISIYIKLCWGFSELSGCHNPVVSLVTAVFRIWDSEQQKFAQFLLFL